MINDQRCHVEKPNKSPVTVSARKLNYQWLLNAIWQVIRICKIRQRWLPVWLVTMADLVLHRLSSWTIFEDPSFSLTKVYRSLNPTHLNIYHSLLISSKIEMDSDICIPEYHTQTHLKAGSISWHF